jgi:hypothetical protein
MLLVLYHFYYHLYINTAKVAGQTLAANYMLGNLPQFSIGSGTAPMQDK